MIQLNVQNEYEESAKSNDENEVSDTLGGVSITSDSMPHSRRFEYRLLSYFAILPSCNLKFEDITLVTDFFS